MVIRLYREYHEGYTKGRLETPFGVYYTIEKPWRDNECCKSCIPEGRYKVFKSKFRSGKHKGERAFRLVGVPQREGILIHIANFVKDVVGCIGVGLSFGDGRLYSSAIAFNQLWQRLPHRFEIEISEDNSNSFLFWKDWEGLEQRITGGITSHIDIPEKVPEKSKNTALYWLLLPFLILWLKK